MVRVDNVFGDITTGKSGEAVYQRKYGRGMRRVYRENKPSSSPAQLEQQAHFKKTLAWVKSLSAQEKAAAKQYFRDNNLKYLEGQPNNWFNWLKSFGLTRCKFKEIDNGKNTYRITHPAIRSVEEIDFFGETMFYVDDLSDVSDSRYQSVFEQEAHRLTRQIKVTTLPGLEYVYPVQYYFGNPYYSYWLYRKTIPIIPFNENDLSDIVICDFQVDFEEGKMNADFSDIRFGLENNVPLSHVLVRKTDGDKAFFDIRLPNSLPNKGPLNLVMYSGNQNAEDSSNPHLTYNIYDDFNDGVINPMWTVEDRGHDIHESDGYLVIHTWCCNLWNAFMCNCPRVYVQNPYSDFEVIVDISDMWVTGAYHVGLAVFHDDGNAIRLNRWQNYHMNSLKSVNGTQVTIQNTETYTWGYYYKIRVQNGIAYYYWSEDGVNWNSLGQTEVPYVLSKIGMYHAKEISWEEAVRSDEFKVKKLAPVNPTYGSWSEWERNL